MVSSITKKLLREKKHINRSCLYINSRKGNILFYSKPQDSNLHIGHLILVKPSTSTKLYFFLYINETYNNEVFVAWGLTLHGTIPFNRNINLSYLIPFFKEYRLQQIILEIWDICFGQTNNYQNSTFNSKNYNINSHGNNQYVVKMLKAWNRTMYKDFKIYSPE